MNLLRNTKIAVVIPNKETAKKYSSQKDILIELRVDLDRNLLSLKESSENSIMTFRSRDEGGKGENEPHDRKMIFSRILENHKGLIDFELRKDIEMLKNYLQSGGQGSRVILSAHDYSEGMEKTSSRYLSEIEQLHNRFPQLKDAIHKFVGMPEDALDLLMGIKRLANLPKRVVLGIGKIGEPSRTLPIGNQFVFGTVSKIPGVMDFDLLRKIHNCENPLFTGLIGMSLDHSLSPSIHSYLREETALCGYYHLFPLKNERRVHPFIQEVQKYGVKGLNVTIPYKEEAARVADMQSEEVKECGAANTLKIDGGLVKAYNTDITGFVRMLEENDLNEEETALVIGAGGVAKAVTYALMKLGIEVNLYNRNKGRYHQFPKKLRTYISFADQPNDLEGDLYINTTPLGMSGQESPTQLVPFPKKVKAVIDIAYSRKLTGLVKEAKKKNIPWIDGKQMLFHQAADAFEIWTGKTVNRQPLMEKWLSEVQE